MTKVMSQDLGIHQILTKSSLRNFTYMLSCSGGQGQLKGQDWICIDPYDGGEVWDWLGSREGNLRAIINTHEHWDHIRGNAYLVERTDCRVYAHRKAKAEISEVTQLLSDGDIVPLLGERVLRALDTPGHTFACLTYMLVEREVPKAIFTGDTLFNAGVGNCRNGGNPKILFQTISEIYGKFPDDLLIYPGHEYLGNNLRFTLSREPSNQKAMTLLKVWEGLDWDQQQYVTSFGEEKEINAFLRLNHPEITSFLEGDISDSEQVFLRLREMRDKW